MNYELMEQIVRHVFANFAVIPSGFINFNKSKSLMDKDFLLNETIPFSDENGSVHENKVWGCQLNSEQQQIRILLGDCSEDKTVPEYALLLSLKDGPTYGLYIVNAPDLSTEALIGVTMNGTSWIECSTYLQATFLAGMEQIKDLGLGYKRCPDPKEELAMLLDFIKFHHSVYEDRYEGQED